MRSELSRLVSEGLGEARASRGRIPELARSTRGFPSSGAHLADVAARTVSLTLLAGSGSRWVKSLAGAASLGRELAYAASFDAAKPRGLFPVRNFLEVEGPRIPIASYALEAVRIARRRILVVRGYEEEIEAEILRPLGFAPGSHAFFNQAAPFGKPLGHGDAAWQCRALWSDADYVVCNFGGDANSRKTLETALLALDALVSRGEDVDLLMPAALIPNPAYPIRLDEAGLPRGFGHLKLAGASAAKTAEETAAAGAPGGRAASPDGYTNVGLRLYRASALLGAVEEFRARYWKEGEGYAIPGNDPAGHEFALDNVDSALAAAGKARILAIADPEELTPAKSLEDVPAFEAAMERVAARDRT